MVELLAPAGDFERFKMAIEYGADAVYFGGKQFSLRARASNFDLNDIQKAVLYAHERGKKVYVTVNMIPHNSDFIGLKEYLQTLDGFGVDAIICASQGILSLAKSLNLKMEVHVSTQQTTTNRKSIDYWKKHKADRVVLARETTLEDVSLIMKDQDMPIEVFIHGGMCANFSGRCTISNLLTNRDANRGGCAQSCRWNYNLFHNDENLNREEYLLSMGSKDMCAVDYLNQLLDLKVASLKVEGRMKTAYYIAHVMKGYRYLIDAYNEKGYISNEELAYGKSLLAEVANRETFAGFYQGQPTHQSQLYDTAVMVSQNYVASVLDYKDGYAFVEDRNYFEKGNKLIVMNPKGKEVEFILEEMFDLDGNEVIIANKPMQKLKFKVPVEVNEFSFIKLAKEK